MKKSLLIFTLVISLIFSFSSIGLANNANDIAKVLSKFEGDWSSVLGFYVLSVTPIEDRDDRFQIHLSLPSAPFKNDILRGQVEMVSAEKGLFNYVFNPEEEAEYTGGTIKFINKSIELNYVDTDNKKHVLIFNKQNKGIEGKQ